MKLVIVDPSGEPDRDALEANCGSLAALGFNVDRLQYPDAGYRLGASGIEARRALLTEALSRYDVILCARGGYGMSDLLPLLDWDVLTASAPRLVAGFSDVSALHSALYTRLGWPSLHGPMPGSALWKEGGEDVAAVYDVLRSWPGACGGTLAVSGFQGRQIGGPLFGGCLSVLGALIGTPFFPSSLAGHIVFLEDVNESAPRVLRHLNQWLQAGILDGVAALVLGRFVHAEAREHDRLAVLPGLVRERIGSPVFESGHFGHAAPNMPLMIGAMATVGDERLTWRFDPGPMLA